MALLEKNNKDRPIPFVRPPYLYIGALIIGITIHLIVPLRIFNKMLLPRFLLASILIGAGIMLVVWAVKTLFKAEVDPRFKPVGQIVTAGPFGFTRNPMYVSFTIVYIGLTVAINSLWPILILPIVIAIMVYGVIKREEKYLVDRFGQEYNAYKTNVRRWI